MRRKTCRRIRFQGTHSIRSRWLASALDEVVKEPGPYLLNVEVTSFENVYPMVPAGGAIGKWYSVQPVEVTR